MLISVVIPFYNELLYINRAIKSVIYQFDEDNIFCEILIGNDGQNSTEAILSAIDKNYHAYIKIIHNVGNKGPGGARNSCLKHVKGDLIAFLDADDYWVKGKLKEQIKVIDSGYSFVVTGYSFDNSNVVIHPPQKIRNSIDVFKCLGIGTSTVLVKASLCKNKYFCDIRFAQDLDYWYSLADLPNYKYGFIKESYVVYSTSGSTKNKFEQLLYFKKVLKINNINIIDQIYILMKYSIRGIINHFLRKFYLKK